jgi:acyl-CoA thioesterase FadM
MGKILELRSRTTEIKGRKIIVSTELSADSETCARGEAVMVRIPEDTTWGPLAG